MTENDKRHPTRIDHFRIERVIVQRDDRVVYRAFDENENRASAIKVGEIILPSGSLSFDAWSKNRLLHPSIISFHGIGQFDGREYVASEFADGGTVDGFLDQVRSSIPRSVKTSDRLRGEYIMSMVQRFYDICAALAHIHEQGFYHGNLKPSNIAICTNRNQFKLADIGTYRKSKSSTHVGIADVAYRAPELIAEDGREPNWHVADVYALGMILYESLTLSLPFDRTDTQRFISQALTARPLPAASRNSSLPTNIESVIMKAIAREPSQRYHTALEFAEELQRILMDQKVEAPEVSPSDRILAGLKRHWRATLVALILIAVAGILFFRNYIY